MKAYFHIPTGRGDIKKPPRLFAGYVVIAIVLFSHVDAMQT